MGAFEGRRDGPSDEEDGVDAPGSDGFIMDEVAEELARACWPCGRFKELVEGEAAFDELWNGCGCMRRPRLCRSTNAKRIEYLLGLR